jgi:hypothetical protein
MAQLSHSVQRGPATGEVRVRSSQNVTRWVMAVAFVPSVSMITVGRPKARANVSWIDWSLSTLIRSVSRHGGADGRSCPVRAAPAAKSIRLRYLDERPVA